VLTLGLLAVGAALAGLTGFCCAPLTLIELLGLGLGIPAWIMGAGDLKKMGRGEMDPSGRGTTMTGMVCGIIGTILAILLIIAIIVLVLIWGVAVAAGGAGGPGGGGFGQPGKRF
jgi:hypothetical protein